MMMCQSRNPRPEVYVGQLIVNGRNVEVDAPDDIPLLSVMRDVPSPVNTFLGA